jgi:chromatin structure-remodeling complex subunit RSC1/2
VARPLHSQASESAHAVTTFRIPTKDRIFTDEMTYKGMTIRVGDWVHLMNPDEPSKPIIAQVFKTWIPDGDGLVLLKMRAIHLSANHQVVPGSYSKG